MVYISRSPLPGYKAYKNTKTYFKQVCIYGFSKEDLTFFWTTKKKFARTIEDIEILRFLEFNRGILMFECSQGSLAVDVPSDVLKVEQAMRSNRS